MKAFEEWFKKYHDGRLATVRGTAVDTWRAALEWARSKEWIDRDGRFISSDYLIDELEDE